MSDTEHGAKIVHGGGGAALGGYMGKYLGDLCAQSVDLGVGILNGVHMDHKIHHTAVAEIVFDIIAKVVGYHNVAIGINLNVNGGEYLSRAVAVNNKVVNAENSLVGADL